jgi:hypothetical protein
MLLEGMDVLSLLTIFGLGAVELWAAIPTGLALQIHPVVIVMTSTLGAVLGIVVVSAAGERVGTRLLTWFGGARGERNDGRIGRVWARYGVIGLGLLSPLLVGAPIGTAVGLTLGAPAGRLLLWMSVGAALCSAGLTLACTLGLVGLQALVR